MAITLNGTALRVLTLNATNIETVTLDGATVARKPAITTQPVGGTINDNQSHAMSVAADGLGTALTYQWFMDGGAISGATAASYTFNPAGNTTNRTFFCRVSGFGGGYTQTSTVTVTVNPSWAANTTIGKAHVAPSPGFIEYWGWDTIVNQMGSLSPNPPTGQSMGYVSIVSAFVVSENTETITINEISPPSGSYVRLETSAGVGWNATHTSSWNYALPADSRGWLRTQGSAAIRLLYYASLDALEANEPLQDYENIDDYHTKWGVHKGQRPDLYKA